MYYIFVFNYLNIELLFVILIICYFYINNINSLNIYMNNMRKIPNLYLVNTGNKVGNLRLIFVIIRYHLYNVRIRITTFLSY